MNCNGDCVNCLTIDACEFVQAVDNELEAVVDIMREINHGADEPAPGTAELAWVKHRARTLQ